MARDIELLEWQADRRQDQHRNLRSIFEYAWFRLPEDQQQLLTGLAVFGGGFTREEASAVLNATLPQLLALIDASLLRMTETGRYDLHPLLFGYIREKLSENSARRMELQDRHARYFAEQGEEAWRAFENGRNQRLWTAWEKAEYSNVETALEWAEHHQQVELGLRLCRTQIREWLNRGQVKVGSERLLNLLKAAGDLVGTSAHRWALVTVCYLRQCLDQREWNESDIERLDVTLSFMQEAHDTMGIFRTLNMKAISVTNRHDMDRSLFYFREALRAAEYGNFHSGQAAALTNLALIALTQMDLPLARSYAKRAVDISFANMLELNEVMALGVLGRIEILAGDYEAAGHYFDRGFKLSTSIGQQHFMKMIAHNIGESFFYCSTRTAARRNGNLDSARVWFERAKSLSEVAGLKRQLGSYSVDVGDIFSVLGDFDAARSYFESELALSVGRDETGDGGSSRIGLGNIEHEEGRYELALKHFKCALTEHSDIYTSLRGIECLAATLGKLREDRRAATLWGAAAHFRQSKGLHLHPIFREQYEAALEETRSAMGESEFQAAWTEGEQLSLERAIGLALRWSTEGA